MLKKIRAQPEHIKKTISLVITMVISGIIFVVWLSSFEARQNGDNLREKTLSPIDGFTKVFQGVISNVKNSISDTELYMENISSTATTTPYLDLSRSVVIGPTASSTATTTPF